MTITIAKPDQEHLQELHAAIADMALNLKIEQLKLEQAKNVVILKNGGFGLHFTANYGALTDGSEVPDRSGD